MAKEKEFDTFKQFPPTAKFALYKAEYKDGELLYDRLLGIFDSASECIEAMDRAANNLTKGGAYKRTEKDLLYVTLAAKYLSEVDTIKFHCELKRKIDLKLKREE